MKVICGWCKKRLPDKEGNGVSHGICQDCYDEQLRKYQKPKQAKEKKNDNNKR